MPAQCVAARIRQHLVVQLGCPDGITERGADLAEIDHAEQPSPVARNGGETLCRHLLEHGARGVPLTDLEMDQRQSGPPSRGNRSLLEERGHHGPQFGEPSLLAAQGEDQDAQLIFMHSDAVAPLQRHRLQNQTFRLGQLTSHQSPA